MAPANTILREIDEPPALDLGVMKTIGIPTLLLTGGESSPIFTDRDPDADNLHLILSPEVWKSEKNIAGSINN